MKNMLTKEAFADWCEKQAAGKEYDYMNPCECAFSQYAAFAGFEEPIIGETTWAFGPPEDRTDRKLPAWVDSAVKGRPRTFGALVQRLRAS